MPWEKQSTPLPWMPPTERLHPNSDASSARKSMPNNFFLYAIWQPLLEQTKFLLTRLPSTSAILGKILVKVGSIRYNHQLRLKLILSRKHLKKNERIQTQQRNSSQSRQKIGDDCTTAAPWSLLGTERGSSRPIVSEPETSEFEQSKIKNEKNKVGEN